MEEVDVLLPPTFEPSGEVMTATDAILSGKWLGTANIWIYRKAGDEYEFLFQERPVDSPWMPGKLDVAVGGYLKSGENESIETQKLGAMREMAEELGLVVEPKRVWYVTKRLNASISQKGNERKTCISIFALELTKHDKITLDETEVTSTCWVLLNQLRELYANKTNFISVDRTDVSGSVSQKRFTKNDFIPNYDDYLFLMPEIVVAKIMSR